VIEYCGMSITGSRNLTGPKTLPIIWHTYMKLVTKYQISAINSCWEKCAEKYLLTLIFFICFDIIGRFRISGERKNSLYPFLSQGFTFFQDIHKMTSIYKYGYLDCNNSFPHDIHKQND
jgi:hypothetical protein